jgi:muconate cycloisomerase
MRVKEITAWQVRIPLKKPIQHASHTRTETDNVIVRVVLDNKIEGFGEGVPREYVTGETADSVLALLKQSDLKEQFEDWSGFHTALTAIEHLRLAPISDDPRGCKGNAARCALEIALLDAYGKHFKHPVSDVTKIMAHDDLFEPHEHVRYSGAITSAEGYKARFAAWKMWIYNFKHLKIKVGIDGQDDVDRVGAIRGRVGRKMDIRIDANEAWTPKNVGKRILELKPFNISSVEQPLPHEDVAVLREVRRETGVPIMLDESLCSMIDAEHAEENDTCDLFNLRLSKCGGFLASLRLAQHAKRHQLGYQLGCQIGETAILSAAGRHFAASVKDLRYIEGSYDRHLVKEALAVENLTFGWGGWAPALEGPGLGIEIDPVALKRVTRRTEVLLG